MEIQISACWKSHLISLSRPSISPTQANMVTFPIESDFFFTHHHIRHTFLHYWPKNWFVYSKSRVCRDTSVCLTAPHTPQARTQDPDLYLPETQIWLALVGMVRFPMWYHFFSLTIGFGTLFYYTDKKNSDGRYVQQIHHTPLRPAHRRLQKVIFCFFKTKNVHLALDFETFCFIFFLKHV